ncbi:GTPase Era [Alcanivorax sp. ALC70]|nr:GTPase Era [Alcanivorax sp. ALC70]
MSDTRCGLVAIVGRPNVGKSTLMNHLIGQKVSITSRKPQTTRHRIHGILSRDDYQIVFADTPGIHAGQERALNRAMNDAALSALNDVDVICFMVDGIKWTEGDEHVLKLLQRAGDTPVLLLVNKVDNLEDKQVLLPHLQDLAGRFSFAEIIPVSALRGHNLEALEKALAERLPEGEFWFDDEQLTDRSLRFMAAEIVREKVVRQLGQEVPTRSPWRSISGRTAQGHRHRRHHPGGAARPEKDSDRRPGRAHQADRHPGPSGHRAPDRAQGDAQPVGEDQGGLVRRRARPALAGL